MNMRKKKSISQISNLERVEISKRRKDTKNLCRLLYETLFIPELELLIFSLFSLEIQENIGGLALKFLIVAEAFKLILPI